MSEEGSAYEGGSMAHPFPNPPSIVYYPINPDLSETQHQYAQYAQYAQYEEEDPGFGAQETYYCEKDVAYSEPAESITKPLKKNTESLAKPSKDQQ